INEPLVHLPNGWIRGRQDITVKNVTFYAFEKIPFAAPPVGDLRFKPPQPPQNWSSILNTTHLDKICFQLSRKGPESEDCLYLNVFTPQISGDRLPVMFYVHGGGFYDRTARNLGPDLFIDNGVIFVAANYRLGLFGSCFYFPNDFCQREMM
ncbi:COesterase domain containing protein, partial [Asbolus verrucosus]